MGRRASRLTSIPGKKEGLLRGERSRVVLGRMPEALVTRAKKRTGIDSDTELIEVALANIAVADDYADWRSVELPVDAFRRSPARVGKVNYPWARLRQAIRGVNGISGNPETGSRAGLCQRQSVRYRVASRWRGPGRST